jgi:hypothetical protein
MVYAFVFSIPGVKFFSWQSMFEVYIYDLFTGFIGGTFLYRRVNGVFNATIRWYSCSDVVCICYFNTYTENSPFLL